MGQAHWYFSARINQCSNFDIELDQSRYCRAIVKKYLDTTGTKRDLTHHPTPLPTDFVPTADGC
ncbi:MAG: hypothetical protein ACK53Y_07280, partial [bacterium]